MTCPAGAADVTPGLSSPSCRRAVHATGATLVGPLPATVGSSTPSVGGAIRHPACPCLPDWRRLVAFWKPPSRVRTWVPKTSESVDAGEVLSRRYRPVGKEAGAVASAVAVGAPPAPASIA